MKIFASLEFLDDLNFDRNQVSVNFRIIYEREISTDKIYVLVNSVSYCCRQPTGTVSQHFFRDSCLELE